MRYSNDDSAIHESRLKKELDRLDVSIKICVLGMHVELGFQLACGGLNEDLTELYQRLCNMIKQYRVQIPRYRDEPLDVDWLAWSSTFRSHADAIYSHPLYEHSRLYDNNPQLLNFSFSEKEDKEIATMVCEDVPDTPKPTSMRPVPEEMPILLASKLLKIADCLEEVDNILNNYVEGKFYTSYCKSELDYFTKTSFNKRMRELNKKINMKTGDKFASYCRKERSKLIAQLKTINTDFADDNEIIDIESIGRYIWGKRNNHEEDPLMPNGKPYTITDIMLLVKSADHFESRANGTAIRITDANMLKVQEYIKPLASFVTEKWKHKHQQLWTNLLADKNLVRHFSYKPTSHAEFTDFDLPFVHNMVSTLQTVHNVYVPFDNKDGHPSVAGVNKLLIFEGKGSSGTHRTSLNKQIHEDAVLSMIDEIVKKVLE